MTRRTRTRARLADDAPGAKYFDPRGRRQRTMVRGLRRAVRRRLGRTRADEG